MTAAPDCIVVSRGPGETRAALLAGDRLVEVIHLRDAEAQPGAIYIGRVGERVTGSNDVFIDIGIPPHGVMETKGARLNSGQSVAVEVRTPARADKGPKLARSSVRIPADRPAPSLLKPAPDPVVEWLTHYSDAIDQIVAEPRSEATRITRFLSSDPRVMHYQGAGSAFDEVDEQIEQALQPTVSLPGGGRLIIEQTSALVSIDIDAGSSSIEAANAQAMIEIARQIRLRNLAGHIVIDLIACRARQRFVKALKDSCAANPIQTDVMGLTPSGMIDVIRRRACPSLAETLCDPMPPMLSIETVAYRALRQVCRDMAVRRMARATLSLMPAVAMLLNERLRPALDEARTMGEIVIIRRADFPRERIEVA
ncbi:MAG: hypothetical protein EXR11_14300 [Rhodospirillaceae bacterium]|nr:hypothetical protein [Rhodospirillaceae bacterium]